MDALLESIRADAAKKVITALSNQAGTDVMPAAMPRFLNAVYKLTGLKFKQIGHGRHRDVFDIIAPANDLGLVLKVGNKQSNEYEAALTRTYPEDWAKIYASFDYGIVAERVDMITSLDDDRAATAAFKARMSEFEKRYVNVINTEVGFIGDRIVTVGSSTRVRAQDAVGANGSSGQRRVV